MTRLVFLTSSDKRKFDAPPVLKHAQRSANFVVIDDPRQPLSTLRTPVNRVGFVHQYGPRQDVLVDILLETIQADHNAAAKGEHTGDLKKPSEQKYAIRFVAKACKVTQYLKKMGKHPLFLSLQPSDTSNNAEQRGDMLNVITSGSLLNRLHMDLQGEYDFSRMVANDSSFDMERMLALRLS